MAGVGSAPTLLFKLYRAATALILPLAYRSVARKLHAHGVSRTRIRERLGHASQPRPDGALIWFHAASVGESLSVLSLIARLGQRLPEVGFLITSGTATSAELIAKRMPPRTRHQFAPLDASRPVGRFLAHWRPCAGIIVESELWPVMLVRARAAGLALALVNARLSDKSVASWQKRPRTARFLLDQFDLMLSQNRKSADNLLAMGGDPARIRVGSNLKSTSRPLPVEDGLLARMRRDLGPRPVWIASSTHPGEEVPVLAAHRALLADHPDLCLVLVPRHPERGGEVAGLVADAGFSLARRSTGESPGPETQVYLADTLGETGTWYALSPIVFLGGSLKPIGGHNPFEVALAGAAVISGPHVTNFAETYGALISGGGALEAGDADALARAVGDWLRDADRLQGARDAAGQIVMAQQAALDEVVDTLCAALGLEPVDA